MSQSRKAPENHWRGATALDRVLSRIRIGSECWDWTGHVLWNGYGETTWNGRRRKAHRVVYEIMVGRIGAPTLDHLCRNRRCVRPSHLEPVSQRENVLRGVSTVAMNARKTHCVNGHALTPQNSYAPPSRPERRDCRICRRANAAAYEKLRAPRQHRAVPALRDEEAK